jgi:hypothetical protein
MDNLINLFGKKEEKPEAPVEQDKKNEEEMLLELSKTKAEEKMAVSEREGETLPKSSKMEAKEKMPVNENEEENDFEKTHGKAA